MRQLRQEVREAQGKFEFSNEVIMRLGKQLDSPEQLHIENVYFTSNGDFFFSKTSWKDTETGKTKDYAYLSMETRPWIPNGAGLPTYKLMRVGKQEQEIVFSISAEELVEKYIKLKNKK